MKAAFPDYDYADMVDAQYPLLHEGLGIKHLRLVIGNSMGGNCCRARRSARRKAAVPYRPENTMSSSRFRLIASSLPGVIEGSHHGHADFRAGKRIFATLGYPDQEWGTLILTPDQQSVLVEAEPDIFRPVPGGWGKRGSTNVRLAKADSATLQSALTMAWSNVAPKSQPKADRKVKR